jgi:hypothetical protein
MRHLLGSFVLSIAISLITCPLNGDSTDSMHLTISKTFMFFEGFLYGYQEDDLYDNAPPPEVLADNNPCWKSTQTPQSFLKVSTV